MRDGTNTAQGREHDEMLAEREQRVLAGTALIDARELAERLGYSGERGARTVREKASAGVIPAVRLGAMIRFHWPSVIRALGVLQSVDILTACFFF